MRRTIGPRPAVHYLADEDEDEQVAKGLKDLLSRNAGGTQWTWKKVTVVVDWGAAENVLLRSMSSRDRHQAKERSQNGKGFKGPGGENIKYQGQLVMSIRTLERHVRKSTWQVADVGKPLVSVSHIIQTGNVLFIGKDEQEHEQEKYGEINAQERNESVARHGGTWNPACTVVH